MNPGASVWIFIAYARLFKISDPYTATLVVVLANIIFYFLFVLLGFYFIQSIRERWILLWGISLAWVNPFQILLDRKLWTLSFLPPFLTITFFAWMHRKRFWPAFFWGFLGAWISQVHMSGYFVFFGVFLFTCVFARPFHFWGWTTGSLLGVIPMIPWIKYMSELSHGGGDRPFFFQEIYQFLFYRYWFSFPWGFKPYGNLGREAFARFSTTSILVIQWGLLALGLISLCLVGVRYLKKSDRIDWMKKQLFSKTSPLLQYQNALLIGGGLILTLSMVRFHRYYMAIFFPFTILCWVRILRIAFQKNSRWLLPMIWLSMAWYSYQMLEFLNQNHGSVMGDYGPAYQTQDPEQIKRLDRSKPLQRSFRWW
jgi:hypothetical protein